MNNRILFWISGDLLTFCLAHYMQKNNIGDFYSITDITNKPKIFFKEQTFVNFLNNWFYHDHIHINKNPDVNYLKNFQKKYNIDLMELGKNDRILNKYNEYHDFSKDEIESILENECKLFEMILDEVNPDYFITGETALQPNHLFSLMCKAKGIKVLMLNHGNWKNFCYISETRHKLDGFKKLSSDNDEKIDFNYLQNLWNKNKVSTYHSKYFKQVRNSKISFLRAGLNFLLSKNENIKTHYSYFGRTKFKVLCTEIKNLIKKRQRESFIESNLIKKFNFKKPFLYLPLHQEPERSLLIAAPKFSNQIKTIREVMKNLPENYELYVKEHPTQGPSRGWREISFYQEIIDMPNVKLFHPNFDSKILLQNCNLVISVGGTSSFEASFFAKPSIIFADLGYSIIPSIKKLNSYDELKSGIVDSLKNSVNPNYVNNYIKSLENNSFIFKFMNFEEDYQNWFYVNGNTVDVLLTNEKMEKFLSDNNDKLENLSLEFIKKIQQLD